jgi:hypothetical protein
VLQAVGQFLWAFGCFWWHSVLRILKTPIGLLGGFTALVGLILRAYASYWPIEDAMMDYLTWAIPLAVVAGTVAASLLVGPYLMYREADNERRALLEPKLFFELGEGGHFKERTGDSVYFRIALRTAPGTTVEGVQVQVVTCKPEGMFWHLLAPLRVRGRAESDIFHHGTTVNSGIPEYVQLIRAEYDGNRLMALRPSHVLPSDGYLITAGEYTVELVATGKRVPHATQGLHVSVRNDSRDPVTIEAI